MVAEPAYSPDCQWRTHEEMAQVMALKSHRAAYIPTHIFSLTLILTLGLNDIFWRL